MAGEMHKQDLEEGGDWYTTRMDMEDIGKKAGAIVKVEPFDQYQGPKGKVYFGVTYVGELWSRDRTGRDMDKWFFEPVYKAKLEFGVKPTNATKPNMISFLKKLKDKLPNHKLFDVIPGERPSQHTTPPLKKAQQKSLLHLVKSKYTIKIG